MLRVLAVDDRTDSNTILRLLLQTWGYEALVAVDGPTALKIADSFQPDVLILDIAMPGMHGYEVAKRLRQVDPHKPLIIALSGFCTKDDACRSLEAGCNYHFAKPADPNEIKQILDDYERSLQQRKLSDGWQHPSCVGPALHNEI